MRRPFIAGNWKMNLDRKAAVALASDVAAQLRKWEHRGQVDVAVCPPSCYLDAVASTVDRTVLGVGAQNMYHEPKGAFTGELSAAMLLDVGCKYVILGHSERRGKMGETDEDVNRKLKAALAAGLIPIVCVGETLDQRESGKTLDVIRSQFTGSFAGLTPEQMATVVIAYEPVWAIGTGRTATPEQAEEVHLDLRKIMAGCYNKPLAESVRIQYGGSVTPENAAQLLTQPDIDGALVGGASLKADGFMDIVRAAVR
jgi:triosephosphate isomerase (TIM)